MFAWTEASTFSSALQEHNGIGILATEMETAVRPLSRAAHTDVSISVCQIRNFTWVA